MERDGISKELVWLAGLPCKLVLCNGALLVSLLRYCAYCGIGSVRVSLLACYGLVNFLVLYSIYELALKIFFAYDLTGGFACDLACELM